MSSLQPHHKTARRSLAFRAKGSDADASELAHSCVRLRWLNTPRALPLAKTSPAMRLFSDSAESPSRALGAHDSISEVPGGGRLGHPRACLIHKVLRFWQAGHCYAPRPDRTNREFPHGSSLAADRDPHGFLDKGDVMIHRPYSVAWPAGSYGRTRRPSRAFHCEDRSRMT